MKFNEVKNTSNKTENHEGGEAYKPNTDELALYKVVINNLLENTYYESDKESLEKVTKRIDRVADNDPEFVLKLAAYARQEMGLRQVPQYLLAYAANDDRFKTKPPEPGHHNDTMVRDYVPEIVQRMDETATVRAANDLFDGGDPWCLRKGVADAIVRQENEYILSKYRMTHRKYNLKDIFNWSHPKPENKISDEFNIRNKYDLSDQELSDLQERFVLGDLDNNIEPIDSPKTWEVIISENGNTESAWRDALETMGHMAKIMNLRNMLESGLSGDEIISESDIQEAKNSRMFPFRYYSAYLALQKADISDDEVFNFLENAIDATVSNVPDTLGNSYALADTSGSMTLTTISGRSAMNPKDIAAFFTAILRKKGADVGAFADDVENLQIHPQTPVLEMVENIKNAGPGGATNAYKVIKNITKQEKEYDRVILLTDGQFWDTSRRDSETVRQWWDEYTAKFNNSHLYNIDLASYGHLSVPENYPNVYRINGWNEKIIEFIVNAENPNEVIDEIKSYDPVDN